MMQDTASGGPFLSACLCMRDACSLCYENESMESIMDDLKRWYDFDVVYVGNRVKDYRFELWVSRDSEISVITDLLMKTNRVGIKVNGKTLVVSEVVR